MRRSGSLGARLKQVRMTEEMMRKMRTQSSGCSSWQRQQQQQQHQGSCFRLSHPVLICSACWACVGCEVSWTGCWAVQGHSVQLLSQHGTSTLSMQARSPPWSILWSCHFSAPLLHETGPAVAPEDPTLDGCIFPALWRDFPLA